jgi:acylphosphatase
MTIKTYRITIMGKVQGFGFRYFTHNKAIKLNIKGSVQNLSDRNRVEIYCCGENKQIIEFVNEIKKGLPLSNVLNMDIEKLDNEKYNEFHEFKII